MRRTPAIFLALALFSLSLPALAWIPPSFHIIQSIAKKHEPLTSGRFQHKIHVYKPSGELLRTYQETLTLSESDQATSRLVDEAGSEIATRTRRLLGAKNNDLGRPVLYDLLMVRDQTSIFEHFRALGLSLKSQSELYATKEGALPYKPEPYIAFLRFENKVAIVDGDIDAAKKGKAGSDSGPQLWVERNSYLPLRALFPTVSEKSGRLNSEPIELKFSGYQPYQRGFLYPRSVVVSLDEKPWLRIDTQDVRVADTRPLEPVKAKAELSDEAKEFIEKFYEWVR